MRGRNVVLAAALGIAFAALALAGCGEWSNPSSPANPDETWEEAGIGNLECRLPADWVGRKELDLGDDGTQGSYISYGYENGTDISLWRMAPGGQNGDDGPQWSLEELVSSVAWNFQWSEVEKQTTDLKVAGLDAKEVIWNMGEMEGRDGTMTQVRAAAVVLIYEENGYAFQVTSMDSDFEAAQNTLDDMVSTVKLSETGGPQPAEKVFGMETYGTIAFDPGRWLEKGEGERAGKPNYYIEGIQYMEIRIYAKPYSEETGEAAQPQVAAMLEELYARERAFNTTTIGEVAFSDSQAVPAGDLQVDGAPVEAVKAVANFTQTTEFYGTLPEQVVSPIVEEAAAQVGYFVWQERLYLFSMMLYPEFEAGPARFDHIFSTICQAE